MKHGAGSILDKPGSLGEARWQRRLQVIRLREAGATYSAIAQQTGFSRTGVFDICKRHAAGGDLALHDAPGGQRPADGRHISAVQEALLRGMIVDTMPQCTGGAGSLWTPQAVSKVIGQRIGMELPARTLAAYLVRWGFVARRSLGHAPASTTLLERTWLRGVYAGIAARARTEDARILWANHSPLAAAARGERRARDLPAGDADKQPASVMPALSMLSAVNARRQLCWAISEGALTVEILLDFLRRLVQGATHKVFLMMCWQPVHRDPSVTAWLLEHDEAIELFEVPMPAE